MGLVCRVCENVTNTLYAESEKERHILSIVGEGRQRDGWFASNAPPPDDHNSMQMLLLKILYFPE